MCYEHTWGRAETTAINGGSASITWRAGERARLAAPCVDWEARGRLDVSLHAEFRPQRQQQWAGESRGAVLPPARTNACGA